MNEILVSVYEEVNMNEYGVCVHNCTSGSCDCVCDGQND